MAEIIIPEKGGRYGWNNYSLKYVVAMAEIIIPKKGGRYGWNS